MRRESSSISGFIAHSIEYLSLKRGNALDFACGRTQKDHKVRYVKTLLKEGALERGCGGQLHGPFGYLCGSTQLLRL